MRIAVVVLAVSLTACAGMKAKAIYHGAKEEGWHCPRDSTTIQNLGERRYRLMGCGWLSDYKCVTYSNTGANGAVGTWTKCEAIAPPVPLPPGPPPGQVTAPIASPSPDVSGDAGPAASR